MGVRSLNAEVVSPFIRVNLGVIDLSYHLHTFLSHTTHTRMCIPTKMHACLCIK
jgi:hypothetical protein